MEDFNKVIESLYIKFSGIKHVQILKPIRVEDFYDIQNTIILVNKGSVFFGPEKEEVNDMEILFVPSGKYVSLKFGSKPGDSLKKEEFNSASHTYFGTDQINPALDNCVMLSFEAKVFESVNFFQSTDIPPFRISEVPLLVSSIRELMVETQQKLPGKDRLIKLNTDKIVIGVIRHILENQLFTEKLATNINYFKDPRLLDIFAYIKNNVSGDLSNKTLSNVANVSEDYVGQYFKMLTGINPQDYVEYQRMERAVELLRTTKTSIREIADEVGYKDTAYFCRRFKMMFGLSAGKMRKRETS